MSAQAVLSRADALREVLPEYVSQLLAAERLRLITRLVELEPKLEADPRVSARGAVKALGRVVFRSDGVQGRLAGLQNRLDTCSDKVVECECCGCGKVHEVEVRCEEKVLCEECCRRDGARRRRLMNREVEWAREESTKGERLRLVTVTIKPSGRIPLEERISRAMKARNLFMRQVNLFSSVTYPGKRCDYWIGMEVTPGVDSEGHVHFHALFNSDFLPHSVLVASWADAAGSVGFDVGFDDEDKNDGKQKVRKTLVDRLQDIESSNMRRATKDQAKRWLRNKATMPWTVVGEDAPRRGHHEDLVSYAMRRIIWVMNMAELGRETRRYRLSSLARRYKGGRALLCAEIADFCDVPWLVVHVNKVDKPTTQVIKYLTKPPVGGVWTLEHARFTARVWACTKNRHIFEASQTIDPRKEWLEERAGMRCRDMSEDEGSGCDCDEFIVHGASKRKEDSEKDRIKEDCEQKAKRIIDDFWAKNPEKKRTFTSRFRKQRKSVVVDECQAVECEPYLEPHPRGKQETIADHMDRLFGAA
jgi:hypothetical protein